MKQPRPAVEPTTPLRVERQRVGVTMTALATATDYDLGYVSHIERGIDKPGPRFRAAAASYLGIPESVLFPVAEPKFCPTCGAMQRAEVAS